MQVAMNTTSNAAVNNFLNHAQAANLSREMDSCNRQAGGCDPQQEQAIRDRYIALSNENISAVQSAIVAGNTQEVQRLLSTAATAQEVSGIFSSRIDEQIFVGRQNNVNNLGSVWGDGASSSDVALAQQVQAFRAGNCQGISSSACDVRVEQALNDRATRALLLAGVTATLPLVAQGISRIANGVSSPTIKPVTLETPSANAKPPLNDAPNVGAGANGEAVSSSGSPPPATSANANVGLRIDLSREAGVPTSTSDVWGASLNDLGQAFNTGGATITPGSARPSSSGNAQILNIEGSSTGVVQVQYSPASNQSSHGGQYYKFTYSDGTELKVIDPATYRVLGWPENGGRTTFVNPGGMTITYDPALKTWR
jgi:filamentous hemagglutinin